MTICKENIYILPKGLHIISFINNCTIKRTVLIFNILLATFDNATPEKESVSCAGLPGMKL